MIKTRENCAPVPRTLPWCVGKENGRWARGNYRRPRNGSNRDHKSYLKSPNRSPGPAKTQALNSKSPKPPECQTLNPCSKTARASLVNAPPSRLYLSMPSAHVPNGSLNRRPNKNPWGSLKQTLGDSLKGTLRVSVQRNPRGGAHRVSLERSIWVFLIGALRVSLKKEHLGCRVDVRLLMHEYRLPRTLNRR